MLSTLSESGGISEYEISQSRRTDLTSTAGTVAELVVSFSLTVSQQKVSLFHSLQLKFSSRRPFSRESAHFEKTTQRTPVSIRPRSLSRWKGNVLVHIVNKLSTLVVSTFAMSLMLTESTGDARREGILSCGVEMQVRWRGCFGVLV